MRGIQAGAKIVVHAVIVWLLAGPVEDAVAAYQKGDYATALRLLRPLAAQGDAAAQYNLGLMYDEGRGVTRDDAQAVNWYRKAADQGDANAQNNLGFMYAEGRGVAQDYTQSADWFRKATEKDLAVAQYNLGLMYNKGQGVAQDYVLAYMWINLAAARMPPGGENTRENAVKARDGIAAKMTPEQIAEAQRLAREWKPGAK